MRVVHKYPINIFEQYRVLSHAGGKPIAVALQRDEVCVWVQLELEDPSRYFDFVCVPTGSRIPDGATYIGTVLVDNGDIVLHVYYREVV